MDAGRLAKFGEAAVLEKGRSRLGCPSLFRRGETRWGAETGKIWT